MDTNKLIMIVSLLVTLGLASERLVEIVKGFIPSLNVPRESAVDEAKRKAKISILSILCGILTAVLSSSILKDVAGHLFNDLNCVWVIIALGLLASAGSAFWNSILEYLLKIKDLKKAQIENTKAISVTEVAKARTLNMEAELMLSGGPLPKNE